MAGEDRVGSHDICGRAASKFSKREKYRVGTLGLALLSVRFEKIRLQALLDFAYEELDGVWCGPILKGHRSAANASPWLHSHREGGFWSNRF